MADEQGTMVTPEQLMEQLGLAGTGPEFKPRTPLQEFIGDLDANGISGMMKKGQTGEYMEVTYSSSNIEVIKSLEPYTFPVAQISISMNIKPKSRMGVFQASVDKLVNVDENGQQIARVLDDGTPNPNWHGQDYLRGKRLHWVLTGGHMFWDGQKKAEVANTAWEITEIVGETAAVEAPPAPAPAATTKAAPKAAAKAGKSFDEQALDILTGKTEQQFYQSIFANATFKAPGAQATVQKIINRSFLTEYAARVSKDAGGIYSLVG